MNELNTDGCIYHIANWSLTIGVANRAHRDATGQMLDKFRYNDITGDIYIYDNVDKVYKFIYNDMDNKGRFVEEWV